MNIYTPSSHMVPDEADLSVSSPYHTRQQSILVQGFPQDQLAQLHVYSQGSDCPQDFSTEREILTAYNPLLVQRLHDLHARLTGNTPALPWSVTPVHSPDQTVQSNASTVPQLPPHDIRQDTSPVRGASPGPNPVAQTEAHISRLVCPNCKKRYCTVGARRRHFLANLPHHIRCPYSGCYWTSDRFHGLEVHTENHPPKELVLEEYQIYDPEELLGWMADGTLTFVSAVDNAWLKVEERLTQQDMIGIEAEMRRSVWSNRRKFCIAGQSSSTLDGLDNLESGEGLSHVDIEVD